MGEIEDKVLDCVATRTAFVVERHDGTRTPPLTARALPRDVLVGFDRCNQPYRIPVGEIKGIVEVKPSK